jgi:hypothetical protein
MAEIVAATTSFVVNVGDRPFVVRAGDLFAADDPIVRMAPGRFGAPRVRSSPPPRPRRPSRPAKKEPPEAEAPPTE